MKTTIRGHPPWYARGTPVIKKLEVGRPKTEGDYLLVSCEIELQKARGKPPMKVVISMTKEERSAVLKRISLRQPTDRNDSRW